jgi:hypothetical protein
MRIALALLMMAALAACAPAVPPAEVLPPAMPPAADAAAAFPGLDVNATAACVKENATEGELAIMALGDQRSQAVTAEVLGRPATLACLNRAGVQLPGTPAP